MEKNINANNLSPDVLGANTSLFDAKLPLVPTLNQIPSVFGFPYLVALTVQKGFSLGAAYGSLCSL